MSNDLRLYPSPLHVIDRLGNRDDGDDPGVVVMQAAGLDGPVRVAAPGIHVLFAAGPPIAKTSR
jgi:hypothetical protein